MSYSADLSPEQAFGLLKDDPAAVLVDVRTEAEWSYVGVPDLSGLGAQVALIEWVTFPSGSPNPAFLAELEQAASTANPVLFICRSGVRSAAAASAAAQAGYMAYNVLDGFEGPPDPGRHRGRTAGWKVAGLPWSQS